ncbi:hypothetical protein HUT18_27490 [Streptomyces sp. NA04227]|uniref:class III extradiol dioxygenase subunit B-like domain-containing protein n=1 Tax=Streptomyces sp. NA04227 TaxID=2742136 RepID=UPI001590685F|nr:class III extradiol dioxygenase subunit B-like domain-containing protein [Streptomyces sp. NA04227]QKW09580.1 hypothetical protein HUT18_27490 [Streptomyces sp. NA04227]
MLVAAAVCPCPPLLVPEVAAGAAHELDAARAACAEALRRLGAARPDRLVVVGPAGAGARSDRHPHGSTGSFREFGVDVEVRLGAGEPVPGPLPAALAVAARLLAEAGFEDVPVEGLAVGEGLQPSACRELGARASAEDARLGLLVMGDGSACRTVKAPGYFDERATAFDAEAARALGAADTGALAALDDVLARELKVSGRAPWQILAGAAEQAGLRGELLFEDAPYGVNYLVAAWT